MRFVVASSRHAAAGRTTVAHDARVLGVLDRHRFRLDVGARAIQHDGHALPVGDVVEAADAGDQEPGPQKAPLPEPAGLYGRYHQ